MNEVSLFRLYALRATYALIAVGLGIQVWPGFFHHTRPWDLMHGVVNCILVAISLLAIVGIRHPLRMLPLLLFEMLWKGLWLGVVALPLWRAHSLDAGTSETVLACGMGVIFPIVIPWRYVFAHYVTKGGDPWRPSPRADRAPRGPAGSTGEVRRVGASSVVLLALAGSLCALAPANRAFASPRGDRAAAELVRLQLDAVHASDARDAATLRKLIADDFQLTFDPGTPGASLRRLDRAAVIARWTATDTSSTAFPTVVDSARAEVHDDVGIVTARITDRWRDASGEHSAVTSVADVWQRRAGRWVWVSAHEVLLGEH